MEKRAHKHTHITVPKGNNSTALPAPKMPANSWELRFFFDSFRKKAELTLNVNERYIKHGEHVNWEERI